MKTLLLALFTISVAQADCGGYDCLDVLNLTYEEYVEKHGSPDAQVERGGYDNRDIQVMKYQLIGMTDAEIERQLFIDEQSQDLDVAIDNLEQDFEPKKPRLRKRGDKGK